MKCPYKILTELIYINSGTEAVYQSTESDETIFSDPLQRLEDHDEKLNYVSCGPIVEFVPDFDKNDLEKPTKVILVLLCLLVAIGLHITGESLF